MGIWSDDKFDLPENDSEKIDYIYRRLKGQRVAGGFELAWKWMIRGSIVWLAFQLYTNPMGLVQKYTGMLGGGIGAVSGPGAAGGIDANSLLRLLGGQANPLSSGQVPSDLQLKNPGAMFSPGLQGVIDEENDYAPTAWNSGTPPVGNSGIPTVGTPGTATHPKPAQVARPRTVQPQQ